MIKQSGLPLRGRPILFTTRMITDQIGLHSVLLPLLIERRSVTSRYHGSKIFWITTIGSFRNGDGEQQKNNFARASRFVVQFLAVVARLRHETSQFHAPALWISWAQHKNFLFLFLNLGTVLSDLTRNISPTIIKLDRKIRSTKFETVGIHFLNNVLVCCHPEILLPWQRGRVVSASDSQSGGPGFESRSGHLLDLCSVVPSSNSRPRL